VQIVEAAEVIAPLMSVSANMHDLFAQGRKAAPLCQHVGEAFCTPTNAGSYAPRSMRGYRPPILMARF
jgi:hypothetical protein